MAKVGDSLRFKDAGPSVEEARKAMVAAGEAPKGQGQPSVGKVAPDAVAAVVAADAVADVLEPEIAEEVVVPIEPVAAPLVIAPVPVPVEPRIERVETEQFTGEIKQEKGKWVAELQYKSGAGAERFIADSKNDLMLALLKGKGHATLRVKEAVRREKLGGPKLDREYPLPGDITAEDFTAMPEKQQDALLYTIASGETLRFRDAHPEFYPSPKNAEAVNQYLAEHKLPITLRNLEYAFEDLADNDLLELRPEVKVPLVTTSLSEAPAAPAPKDIVPAPETPVAASAAPVAPAAPAAVVVRKRGTSGLQPDMSSSPSDLGTTDGKSRDLSEAELRKLPMSELKRIADQDRRARSGGQR